ncbi:MAG: hypothetical protein LBS36_05960 [Oscillospiraceae bacterium]|jgi:hypothetical protein|nr:hypothetical protein [Oscillospiraceae bacterium]
MQNQSFESLLSEYSNQPMTVYQCIEEKRAAHGDEKEITILVSMANDLRYSISLMRSYLKQKERQEEYYGKDNYAW